MTEIPKLTADEAAVLRYRLVRHPHKSDAATGLWHKGLSKFDFLCGSDETLAPCIAALAAFDAAERAKIRVEAIRECQRAVENKALSGGVEWPTVFELAEAIRALIAKETP